LKIWGFEDLKMVIPWVFVVAAVYLLATLSYIDVRGAFLQRRPIEWTDLQFAGCCVGCLSWIALIISFGLCVKKALASEDYCGWDFGTQEFLLCMIISLSMHKIYLCLGVPISYICYEQSR
jgi:hypothetical protein